MKRFVLLNLVAYVIFGICATIARLLTPAADTLAIEQTTTLPSSSSVTKAWLVVWILFAAGFTLVTGVISLMRHWRAQRASVESSPEEGPVLEAVDPLWHNKNT